MPVPYVLTAISGFLSTTISRVISIAVGRKLTEQSSKEKRSNKSELVRRDERSRQAEIEYQRGRAKREQELVKIQANCAKMREIEIKAGIAIAAEQLEISEKTLQLRKQELELAKARLRQDKQIAEEQRKQVEHALELRERELQLMAEEQTERRKLSYLYLDLMREKEATEIELKLKKIQANWDRENWSGILSREEMRQILVEGQKKHRLLMIVSPPDIEDCSNFNSHLYKEVRSELKEFLEQNYPLNSDLCPVEYYGKFFKSSVFDTEVKKLEKDLNPVPTVVIYSDVTDQNVYFHVSFRGLEEPLPLTLPWNWEQAKEKLRSEGLSEDESIKIIKKSLVKNYQLIAAFLADLYYLQINPLHEIRLFQLESDLPPVWIKTHFNALKVLQQEKIANYGDYLMNSENRELINLSDSLPMERLAVRMRDESKIIDSRSPIIYKLPLRREIEDTKNLISKCHIGQPSFPEPQEKVLMVVGATGAGKSTLINGMVNYFLGVEWKDNFRFKLITDEGGQSQAHSQTKLITSYTLHPMKGSRLTYKLTIIDTPGFGDTEGLKRDEFITDQIRKFFSMSNGITHLNGIGFVTPATLARLTPTEKYIFHAILSIFGKDVANNIFIMITFADGNKPPVIQAIKEAGVPYSQRFKFNNSAIFPNDITTEDDDEEERDEELNQLYWEIGYKSFEKFFAEFGNAESISLQLTRDVLKERKQLEATVNGLLPQITAAQLKLNEFLKEEAVLTKFKDQIEANKDFNWTDTETRQREIYLKRGEYVTNCLTCNCTCHYPCAIPDDRDKYNCAAMRGDESNAVCTVCPKHCSWKRHVNNPYRFELYQQTVKKTYENIKQRYEDGIQGKIKVESVIECLNKELEEVCEKIFRMIQKVQQCLRRLDEIALKPNPMTQVQYIDLLIESEKREAKFGWEERVKYYQGAREFAVTLSRTQDAAGIKKEADIKEWAKKLISNLKDEKIQEIESASVTLPKGKNDTVNPSSWFENLMRPFS